MCKCKHVNMYVERHAIFLFVNRCRFVNINVNAANMHSFQLREDM